VKQPKGVLVLLLSLPPTLGAGPAVQSSSSPRHAGQLHTGNLLGREGSAAGGEVAKIIRGECVFPLPTARTERLFKKGPDLEKGSREDPQKEWAEQRW